MEGLTEYEEYKPFSPVDTASLQRLVENKNDSQEQPTVPRARFRSQTIDRLKELVQGVKKSPGFQKMKSMSSSPVTSPNMSPAKLSVSGKKSMSKSITLREFSLKSLEKAKNKLKEVQSNKVQEKRKTKKKPKKKKFHKADFIKQMKETENLLMEYENTRTIMEKDRIKMYHFWDLTADKIIAAQKSQSLLKKKVHALEMEDAFGLWEVSRRDKLSVTSRYHIQLRKTNKIYTESLVGAVNQLKTKTAEYLREVHDIRHSTIKIGQEMATYTFESWNEIAKDRSKLLQQCLPHIKIKSIQLNDRLANEIKSTTLQLSKSHGPVLRDRQEFMEQCFRHNLEKSKNLLSLYSTIMTDNFPLVQKLAYALIKKQRQAHHFKKERYALEDKFIVLKDRMAYLRGRYSELRKYIANGTIIRKGIFELLKQRKHYQAKYSTAKIHKEQVYQKNEAVNQIWQESRKQLVNSMFRAKKDQFKSMNCASLISFETAIKLQEFIKIIEHGWNLDVDPLLHPKIFKPKHELKFEDIRVEFGNYLREHSESMLQTSKTTVELYYSYLMLYGDILTKNALRIEDLKLRLADRKVPEILTFIKQKERKVFSQIKKDMDALNSRGS